MVIQIETTAGNVKEQSIMNILIDFEVQYVMYSGIPFQ